MNLFWKILILTVAVKADIEGRHGYSAEPFSRQRICNLQNNIWYPPHGEGIPDPMCRRAFLYMESRSMDPHIQFIQDNEYSANTGNGQYKNLQYVQEHTVPNLLCSAGSESKAGMSLPGKWQTNKVDYSRRGQTIDINYCATAAHDPSFWQVFVTIPPFNVEQRPLFWQNLKLIWESESVTPTVGAVVNCAASSFYKLKNVPLPSNVGKNEPFIYYVRWQRIDAAGEGFYNCIDMEYI